MAIANRIVASSDATSVGMNTIISQAAVAISALSLRTADGWLLQSGHSFAGETIMAALNENQSDIAGGLSVGSGTTATTWKINNAHTGAPTVTQQILFERGSAVDAGVRFNETTDLLEGNEGSGWSQLVTKSNVETAIGGVLAQPFERVYGPTDFNPCKISGASTTNVDWAATSDPTYYIPKIYVTSSQTALNYYAFDILVQLPTGFGDWKNATAAALYIRTGTTKASQNHLDIEVRHKSGILVSGTSCSSATKTSQKASTSGSWTVLTWTKANLTNAGSISWATGDFFYAKVKCEVKSSKYVEFAAFRLWGERT